MTNEPNLLSELEKLVIKAVPLTIISPEYDYDRPFKDLGIDSLDLMSLLLDVQEKFKIKIPDEDVNNITNLRAIAKYITEHQKIE